MIQYTSAQCIWCQTRSCQTAGTIAWLLVSPVFVVGIAHEDVVLQGGILDPGVLSSESHAARHVHCSPFLVHLPQQRCQQARLACRNDAVFTRQCLKAGCCIQVICTKPDIVSNCSLAACLKQAKAVAAQVLPRGQTLLASQLGMVAQHGQKP